MEPTVSSETSAIITQTPGNYPKRNTLHLKHGESLKTRIVLNYLHFKNIRGEYTWTNTFQIQVIFFYMECDADILLLDTECHLAVYDFSMK